MSIAIALVLTTGCMKPGSQVSVGEGLAVPKASGGKMERTKIYIHNENPGAPSVDDTPPPPANRRVETNLYIIYTTKKGDTFWNIAKRQLGNGNRWKEISKLNPEIPIKNLGIGKKIKLPK